MAANLRKVTDYVLLRSSYMREVGLFHGKMGVVISLYAYAKKYDDPLLEEYAWDLFQQVYDGVHTDMPVGMEYGLAGIGYGTTLLQKAHFIDCDLNAVLADVDSKIMERDPRRMTDITLRTGAAGLHMYLSFRQSVQQPLLSFDSRYVEELQSRLREEASCVVAAELIDIIDEPSFSVEEYIDKSISIDGGSSYYILKDTLYDKNIHIQ